MGMTQAETEKLIEELDHRGRTLEEGEWGFLVRQSEWEQIKDALTAQQGRADPIIEDALIDALSGWRYIRETHGELYGVGWQRVEEKLITAIAKLAQTTEQKEKP